jgi:FixJ family two-component response regulator
MSKHPLVCVIDDDESVRESLPDLLKEFGFEARPFSYAKAFLDSDCLAVCNCLILDIAMPGMNGPDLQRELKRQGRDIPIVFITAHVDEKVRRRALEQGAAAYLYKPFSQADLLAALHAAFPPDLKSAPTMRRLY